MGNYRYRATIKTELGNEWLVDIRPANTAAPAPRVMRTSSEGFKLSYKGAGKEFTTPLRGSNTTVLMWVENQDDADFIQDIIDAQDQNFVMEIFKKDAALYPLYWVGYIFNDDIKISYGSFPYTVSIAARDSVAMFKEYKGFTYNSNKIWGYFQQLFSNYSPSGTITQDGAIALSPAAIGANLYMRWAGRHQLSLLGASVVNLWVHMLTSYSGNNTDINTQHNRLDTIIDWLHLWGYRVFLENGFYKILEFRQQALGTASWVEHDILGAPTGATTIENLLINANRQNVILDGGLFSFKPAARQCELTYYPTVPNIGGLPTPLISTRTFQIAGTNVTNAKNIEAKTGPIWCNILQYNDGVNPSTNVTSAVTVDGGLTYQNLLAIYQDNQEWLYSLSQKYFNGAVRSKLLKFSSILVIGKDHYLCNSATLTASTDTWAGEWVKVKTDDYAEWASQSSGDNIASQSSTNNLNFY